MSEDDAKVGDDQILLDGEPVNAVGDDEILLNGESIVMDDIAFDILAKSLDASLVDDELKADGGNPKTVSTGIGESRPIVEVKPKTKRGRKPQKANVESMRIKIDEKKVISQPKSQPPPLKLICTYCKQMFPSRPDFNLHIAKDHPPQSATANKSSTGQVTIKKEPSHSINADIIVESQVTKALGKSIKITHIPGSGGSKPVPKQADTVALTNALPKSTKIMFTPVTSKPQSVATPPGPPGPRAGPPGPGSSLNITKLPGPPGPPGPGPVSVTSAKKLACSLCKNVFLSKPEFQEHMEAVHLNKSKMNIKPVTKSICCDVCASTFDNDVDLRSHKIQKHTERHRRRLQNNCDMCDEKFSNKKDLKKHITSEHSKKKVLVIPAESTDSFKCSECKLGFESEANLESHKSSHSYFCEECGLQFEKKEKLLSHKKSHALKCTKCRKIFENIQDLESHEIVHKVKCEYCDELFDRKDKKEQHKQVHLLKCKSCKETLFDEMDMESHVKVYHTFKCEICDKVFDQMKVLSDHEMKEHTFKCKFCEAVFDERELMEAHEKDVHQTCDDCEDEFTWTEEGHMCYYTRNKLGPATDRVQVQNLYFDEYTCYYI